MQKPVLDLEPSRHTSPTSAFSPIIDRRLEQRGKHVTSEGHQRKPAGALAR